MRITVLYFASAREKAGTRQESLELPAGASVAQALQLILKAHPLLQPLAPHLRVSVNQELRQNADPIPDGAEVALIPPVAGGAGLFALRDGPLSLQEAVDAVKGEAYGGLVTFAGAVRAETGGRAVVRLEYEAYLPMARKMFERIGEEVAARWPGTRLAIVHRIGPLLPGELAVVIAAAAPHRKEAFRACEHAIDRIKEEAPIWKKELYVDGEVWVGPHP